MTTQTKQKKDYTKVYKSHKAKLASSFKNMQQDATSFMKKIMKGAEKTSHAADNKELQNLEKELNNLN